MIPKKISLENFMCFRAAALDFSGFRVACLAGDNGAGKSALLDALTWALWGRSRARRDDELIYYGADEMAVEFTFGLGGQTYRVARRRRAGKRGSTLLEFQVGQREDWRCLSETTIRGTQAKIETVLRLDYATFVNSAFIRQGRADEFTTKTAGERKRVLSDILNLDRWVDYENRVKERRTAVRSQVALAELRLREIDEEVENLPRYEADYAAAQVTLADLSASVKVAQAEAGRIEAARTAMRHCLSQIDDLERRISDAERELQRLAGERTGLRTEVAELDGLLADADSISAGYCTYLEAVGRERALGAKLLESVELTARRSELEVHIANARRELETERDVLGQRIADLQDRLPDPAEVAEREEALARIAHLTSLSESRDAARVDLARLAEERATLRAQNEALREDMLSLSSRIAQLE